MYSFFFFYDLHFLYLFRKIIISNLFTFFFFIHDYVKLTFVLILCHMNLHLTLRNVRWLTNFLFCKIDVKIVKEKEKIRR